MDYGEFVKSKAKFDKHYGFDVGGGDVHPALLPHQRAIVMWAVKGGRRAIFAKFGLGKSVMQIGRRCASLLNAREARH